MVADDSIKQESSPVQISHKFLGVIRSRSWSVCCDGNRVRQKRSNKTFEIADSIEIFRSELFVRSLSNCCGVRGNCSHYLLKLRIS